MVPKKILLYTESCRDAAEEGPFIVPHLEFDSIWNKAELSENFDITLPSCLEIKFKDTFKDTNTMRGAPQDAGHRYQGEGGKFENNKRGRDSFNRSNENKGAVVHNAKLKRSIMIKNEEFGLLMHSLC